MKVNDFNFESHSIAAIQKKVPENINLIRDPKKSVGILGYKMDEFHSTYLILR